MKIFFIVFFLCFNFILLHVNAQDSEEYSIETHFDAYYNSNSLTNSFYQSLLSGYIDNETKNDVLTKLSTKNKMGFLYEGRFQLNFPVNDTRFYAGLSANQHAYSTFSPGFFQLVFIGNSSYAGETMNLSPLSITNFTSQSIYAGIYREFNIGNYRGLFSGGIAFIKGSKFLQLKLEKGDFYTSPNGSLITLDTRLSIFEKNDGNFFSFNGLGTSLHGKIELKHKNNDKIQLGFRDLGIIRWKNGKTYDIDDNYRFEGVETNSIYNLQDSVFNNNIENLGDLLNVQQEIKSTSFFIPVHLEFSYLKYLDEKFSILGNIEYYANSSYLPRLSIIPSYQAFSGVFFLPIISYGGYGQMDYGLGIKYKSNRFFARLNTYLFEYLLAPSITSGLGFSFHAGYKFY